MWNASVPGLHHDEILMSPICPSLSLFPRVGPRLASLCGACCGQLLRSLHSVQLGFSDELRWACSEETNGRGNVFLGEKRDVKK